MDPITAATAAVPLQTTEQAQSVRQTAEATATTGTEGVEPGGGTAADGEMTDAQMERYKAVAAGFVQQMYMTMWREAQRNSSA